MNTPSNNSFAKDYIDVATRIAEFRRLYPTGSLRPVNPEEPVKIISIGEKTYLQYVAAAYRTPDDACPGVGIAWEPFPGRTPFTRDSEAANAETSAWGRAIVAALAADTKHGVASLDEVENAKARQAPRPIKTSTPPPAPDQRPTRRSPISEAIQAAGSNLATDAQVKKISILRKELGLTDEVYRDRLSTLYGVASTKDLTPVQASDLLDKLEGARSKKAS